MTSNRDEIARDATVRQIEIDRLFKVREQIRGDLQNSQQQNTESAEKISELSITVQGMESLLADRQCAYDDVVFERDEARRRTDDLSRYVADHKRKEVQLVEEPRDSKSKQEGLKKTQDHLEQELAVAAKALQDTRDKASEVERKHCLLYTSPSPRDS